MDAAGKKLEGWAVCSWITYSKRTLDTSLVVLGFVK